MKHKKILRILGIALILSLLLLVVPASPAMGAAIIFSPTSGAVGSLVSILGSGFTASQYVLIYFSIQPASQFQLIGTAVTNYVTIGQPLADLTGGITANVTIPPTIGTVPVTSGTYYIYTVIPSSANPNTILTASTFTVIGNPAISLNPTTGAAGATVTITGSNFTPSTILTATFDTTTTLTITSGQTASLGTGAFVSGVTIPSSATAGAHTITVTASPTTVSATFTVTASGALDPLSPTTGPPGTAVMISGSSFPVSTALVFKFETTVITPTSGDIASRASGIFITTITIPSTASSGAHTITVTTGTGIPSVTATFTVTGGATLTPTLGALSPATGLAGTDFTISGTNFPASTTLVFTFDTVAITPKSGNAVTLATGAFSSVITVPSTATAAAHTITVTAGSGSASATFTVTTTTPTAGTGTLSISASGNSIGSLIGIGGAGFKRTSPVTITYDGTSVATGTADASGYFVVTFQVPAGKHGNHSIIATDGTNTSNITFTVESTPPQVPVPLKPEMGVSIKSPYFFDWKDVTDTSAPVTYDLQIATAADFAAGSIVLDKTGLTQSEYTLTDTEGLRLSNQVPTYYWRERAVDAASNPSSWTGAGEFTVSVPFKFTGWPMYVSIGAGVLVVFLLGLWVGRRSAFSY